MTVHVAFIDLMAVTSVGSVKKKSDATINEMMTADTEHRIIADTEIPSSVGNPTIKAYLEAEEVLNFRLGHMDQYMIVTYSS